MMCASEQNGNLAPGTLGQTAATALAWHPPQGKRHEPWKHIVDHSGSDAAGENLTQ
jgi:hypothetical protein